jgi:hypothetical protein
MTDAALQRRMTELEGEVLGEKIVTRHVLEQMRANTDLLLEIRRELTTLNQKVDKIGDRVALQGAQLTSFETKFAGLAADALREVLKSRSSGG